MKTEAEMIEDMNLKNTYMLHNNVHMVTISDTYAENECIINEHSYNINRGVHGGLMMLMADTSCGGCARADGRKYVTVDCHFSFLKGSPDATRIISKGYLVKRGKTMVFTRGEVWDPDRNILMATAEFNFFCLGSD